mgnify:CR=1 FL=1
MLANSMELNWSVLDVNDNWWWTIDNVQVYGRRPDNISLDAYVQEISTEEDVAANIILHR